MRDGKVWVGKGRGERTEEVEWKPSSWRVEERAVKAARKEGRLKLVTSTSIRSKEEKKRRGGSTESVVILLLCFAHT